MELDSNTLVVVGAVVVMIFVVIAAKSRRGMAAALSFAGLVTVIALRYWNRNRCPEGETLVWKFCMDQSQVGPPPGF